LTLLHFIDIEVQYGAYTKENYESEH
jgi:hypothetical protein